jgi:hypothetical protein
VTDSPSTAATVSADRAREAAGPGSGDPTLAIEPGAPSRLVWAVRSDLPDGATRTLVDARTGSVVDVQHIEQRADGTGRVFDPNPVVTLRNPALQDGNDADLAVLAPAYRTVPLTHLDGSGLLRGDYADVIAPSAVRAFSASLAFPFDRSAPGFSQTMAYFHVTTAQEYIQGLGFTDVNNKRQQIRPDGMADDASYFDGISIVLGSGGVDDAEDAEIIWHEYGHAVQFDQFLVFGGGDTGAIGEGFGDYLAATLSQPVSGGYGDACLAEWNSAGLATPRPCLRRVDSDLTVADRTGNAHADGQIWSRALWDLNSSLGRDAANILILESQFAYPPRPTFVDAAAVTVETARRLYGGSVANGVRKAFADRGIASKARPAKGKPSTTKAPPDLHEVARLGGTAPGGSTYEDVFEPYDLNDKSEAIFASNLRSGGQAVFTGGKGSVRDVARSGGSAPGGGVFDFGIVPGAGIDRAGNAAFAYYLAPFALPVGTNVGVYRNGPGGTNAIVTPYTTPAPTGGVFLGAGDGTSINDRGVVAFSGIVPTPHGVSDGIGMGVFLAQPDGSIRGAVVPGDPAPGGGTFDYAAIPSINGTGDVAFTGHVTGTACESGAPQEIFIGCFRDLFVWRAGDGRVERLVSLGAGAPGGGVFLDVLNPVMGDNGDVLFVGVVGYAGGAFVGVFTVHDGQVQSVAREGDAMPGGGRFLAAGLLPGSADINDRGDVAFSATLDTDDNGDGLLDQGLYRLIAGKLTVVVRTGVELPSGQVVSLSPIGAIDSFLPLSGAALNHSRRLLWQATVVDGAGVLRTVLYTSG